MKKVKETEMKRGGGGEKERKVSKHFDTGVVDYDRDAKTKGKEKEKR